MKKILLTGAGGFLGRQLLWHLKESDDYFVYAVTSNVEKLRQIVSASNIEIVEINTEINWNEIDIVIHGAFARTGKSHDLITSLEYSNNIFQTAISNKVPAIINISSQSVYGNNENIPWTENEDMMPNDMYGLAKASSEILLKGLSKNSSTVITNIRLSSIMLNARFVNVFVQNAIDGNPINIVGGTQRVSFMDIRDAVDGIIALLNISTSKWEQAYNLGTGKQNSIVEIAEIVKEVAKSYTDKEVVINIDKKDISLNPCMDVSKFTNLTSWTAQYDINEMVRAQFEYLTDVNRGGVKSIYNYPMTFNWQ